MLRREFLDSEVRKLMDKREQTVADLERQNELLDQWAMLQWQRAAVLQPRPGSGVPGAPTSWSGGREGGRGGGRGGIEYCVRRNVTVGYVLQICSKTQKKESSWVRETLNP